MTIYLFNPEHDMALASFSPHYKAPAEIIRMRNDLSGLPLWYAENKGMAWVPTNDYAAAFQEQCVPEGIVPYGGCITLDEMRGKSVSNRMPFVPWGWDPSLVQFLKDLSFDSRSLPDAECLRQIRMLSGRQQCVLVLDDFTGMEQVCGEATVCNTLNEVRTFLSTHDDVILKAPWSGSGRGLTRTSAATWTPNLEGWVGRILRTQGSIMAEPIYNKVYDFAMEFRMNAPHRLSFAGYSLFETDTHGNYKENVLASNEYILEKLTQCVPLSLLEQIKKQLLQSLSYLLSADYVGYFGVDMMICKDESCSLTAPVYKVHPCVEINLRMNMGVVARLLYDRYMDSSSIGSYVVEHYSADGEALEHDRELRALYPSRVVDGKMVEGYFPLTPVTVLTRYQCYILCHPVL